MKQSDINKENFPEHFKLEHEDYEAIDRFATFLAEEGYILTVQKAHGDEMPVDVEVTPYSAVLAYFGVNEKLLNEEVKKSLTMYRWK